MTTQSQIILKEKRDDYPVFFSALELIIIGIGIFSLLVSFVYNDQIMYMARNVRFGKLNVAMLLITNKGLAITLVAIGFYVIWRRKTSETALIIFSFFASLGLSYIIKKVFHLPRPYTFQNLTDIALTTAYGYSFPSLHATVCFSIIPFLKDLFPVRWIRYMILGVLLTIVVSRTYLGVHYLSDIIAGGLIGYITAKICYVLQHRYRIIEALVGHIRDKLELRRQIAHMATGTILIILLKMNYINMWSLLTVLIAGGFVSLLIKYVDMPFVDPVLGYFDRRHDIKKFPGKGAFYFILGCTLSLFLFDYPIAIASIAIMTYGDAITTLTGTYFGHIKNPLNQNKHLEGTLLAIMVSTIAAFGFVSFPKAFLGSVAGMVFESFTIRFVNRIIDDNVIIPVVAGIVMTAMA